MSKCWFHKWKEIYKSEIIGEGSYFIHRRCLKCNHREIINHSPFFSGLDEAVALGTAMGIYKAFNVKDGRDA